MKIISFGGGSLTTGDAVAASLLECMSRLSPSSNSVSVDIPVLEADGTVGTHTIVLSAAVVLDVVKADDYTQGEEAERFPAPAIPDADDVMVAVIPSDGADEGADNFNNAIAEINSSLERGKTS